MSRIQALAESGKVPDPLLRFGIRQLLRGRLRELPRGDAATREGREALLESMRSAKVALHTNEANEQHYELPAEFFLRVLGARLKYSCGFWPEGVTTLDAAEEAMLTLTCERAGIADGMEVLDLGCGWGSLALWMSEQFPASRVLAVSNSAPQRRFIEAARDQREISNLQIVTADMNHFDPARRFDRVVSIEMFEHMRNYQQLLARIATWLNPHGRLFVHVFCHREHPYLFEDRGPGDWMARHFFTGGLMPSEDIFHGFEDDLIAEQSWRVDGLHYQKTALAWLANQDRQREECLRIFSSVYGAGEAERWFYRWRIFFLACAELFGFREGSEWYVAHTLLRPRWRRLPER